MRTFLILLSVVLICDAWEPQVGDTCLTTYFSNSRTKVIIAHIEWVGFQRGQAGYVFWAKTLSGKDSIMGVDGSFVYPYRKTAAIDKNDSSQIATKK
jgi:hypothetical protein